VTESGEHEPELRCWRRAREEELVVGFHNYNEPGCDTEACWNSTIAALASQVPVVTEEFGENRCRDTFIKQYMPWADAHGVS
jgi:endoglucanase